MDSNKYVHQLKRHLEAVTEMLTEVIENCPDGLWVESTGGRSPVWHQVYHAVSGMDFWLRTDFSEAFRPLNFEKDISDSLGRWSDATLSKQEMSEYVAHVKEKALQFFDFLDDERLLEPIGAGPLPNHTYGDALIGQIRHVQYHVSECNVRLGDDGHKAAEWIDPD